MLHVVIYLIHQGVPISDIPATLLKVRRLDNVLEKHRVEMKGIIRAPHRYQILRTIILRQSDEKVKSIDKEIQKKTYPSFLNSEAKKLLRLSLAIFHIAFLAP
jgi:hypothetical protein